MKSIREQRYQEWSAGLKHNPTVKDAFDAGWKYAIDQAILMMREKEIEWKDAAEDFSVGVGVTASKIGADLL